MFDWIDREPESGNTLVIDGKLHRAPASNFSFLNRGFLYGDGFFETIRVANGIPQHLPLHQKRIESSLEVHRIEPNQTIDFQNFKSSLEQLCKANNLVKGGRIRVTFFRSGAGRYTPEQNQLQWIATAEPLDANQYEINEKGLRVDLYPEMKKSLGPLANFKNISASLYVHASLWAQNNQLDDALISNDRQNVIESTRSNLFLVSNRVLYTSGLETGPVGGVMRAAVINLALANGYKVYECNLSPQEMLRADELFLTNAIRGIEWVASYRTKRYFNSTSKELLKLLNSNLSR